MEHLQIVATTPTREDAVRISAALLEAKLAACVQIGGPIESRYWWQGRIESAQEWTCTIKSAQHLFDAIEREIKRLHPYETPEIIATAIVAGSLEYLSWVEESVRTDS